MAGEQRRKEGVYYISARGRKVEKDGAKSIHFDHINILAHGHGIRGIKLNNTTAMK